MSEREHALAGLDLAVKRGIADLDAGRFHDADDVLDALEAELEGLPDYPAE